MSAAFRFVWQKKLKIAGSLAVLALVVLLAIQAVPYGRDHDNSPVRLEPNWDSPRTRELTVAACFDCHSNEVVWPWYSNVAPVSWYVQSHVDEGRRELNFSEWDLVQDEADEVVESIRDGEMPPWYYTVPGTGRSFSNAELGELTRGLRATMAASGYPQEGGEDGEDGEDDEDEDRR
ncbi:MAG: heme-binding domain-containing protein [Chloroflexi bacterium]|nr:heme-binding domain-containing protein [Chloroflexota bacterium]